MHSRIVRGDDKTTGPLRFPLGRNRFLLSVPHFCLVLTKNTRDSACAGSYARTHRSWSIHCCLSRKRVGENRGDTKGSISSDFLRDDARVAENRRGWSWTLTLCLTASSWTSSFLRCCRLWNFSPTCPRLHGKSFLPGRKFSLHRDYGAKHF